MIYEWKDGAHVHGLAAQPVGERLELLRTRHDGALTAEIVVRDARPARSLLHPAFEWDDSVAAQEYRLEQARSLIRSVVVIYEDHPEQAPIRAFVVVKDNGYEPAYTSTRVALSDVALRDQVVARALRELESWERRYEQFAEFSEIFAAAQHVRERQLVTV